MRVKLKCTNCANDPESITGVLCYHKIRIVKTKIRENSMKATIIIKIESIEKLSELLLDIIDASCYGATVVSVRRW